MYHKHVTGLQKYAQCGKWIGQSFTQFYSNNQKVNSATGM